MKDPERSFRFYKAAFGVKECYRDEETIHVTSPGAKDVIAFERKPRAAGKKGGVEHFGFRLKKAGDIDAAVEDVKKAGGKLLRRGEFARGMPYAYVEDPDGYEIEIWYE